MDTSNFQKKTSTSVIPSPYLKGRFIGILSTGIIWSCSLTDGFGLVSKQELSVVQLKHHHEMSLPESQNNICAHLLALFTARPHHTGNYYVTLPRHHHRWVGTQIRSTCLHSRNTAAPHKLVTREKGRLVVQVFSAPLPMSGMYNCSPHFWSKESAVGRFLPRNC